MKMCIGGFYTDFLLDIAKRAGSKCSVQFKKKRSIIYIYIMSSFEYDQLSKDERAQLVFTKGNFVGEIKEYYG